MKMSRHAILLAGLLILAAMSACSAMASKPTVSNIRMTTDETGKTSTSSYAPSDTFYVIADLSSLAVGQLVEAKWYAVNANGIQPNSQIHISDYKYEAGISFVYFKLSTSDGSDWPTGTYRVDVYLDGTKVGEQGFTVQ